MAKITLRDLSLKGKRVLVRVDYNVPLQEKEGVQIITNDKLIKETVPTIKYLIEQGARILLCAHLGRPKGKRDPKQSLAPVVPALSALIGVPVKFVDDCVGEKAEKAAAELKDRIILRCREHLGDITGMAEMYVGTIHGFCLELLKTEVPK